MAAAAKIGIALFNCPVLSAAIMLLALKGEPATMAPAMLFVKVKSKVPKLNIPETPV